MIRNEIELRNARKNIDLLRGQAEEREHHEGSEAVWEGLKLKIEDLSEQVTEYEKLKDGEIAHIAANNLDDLGELLIKSRIARNWSHADLAEQLNMEPQQVQRYERDMWQKASLWRIQELAEALELEVGIHIDLNKEAQEVNWADVTEAIESIYALEAGNDYALRYTEMPKSAPMQFPGLLRTVTFENQEPQRYQELHQLDEANFKQHAVGSQLEAV